jgi:hypothetical protein
MRATLTKVGYLTSLLTAGVGPGRRVLIVVNPTGGKGKGRSIVKEIVLPILEAAGCVVEVIGEACVSLTDNRNNAQTACGGDRAQIANELRVGLLLMRLTVV